MMSVFILAGAIVALLLFEAVSPRTGKRPQKGPRWAANASLGLLGYGIGKVTLGAGLLGLATWAARNQLGLFALTPWPLWFEGVLAVIILDFALWAQHAAFHKLAFLWPLHRVHHSDDALDVTTAWRFHPGEIMLSLGLKAAVIIALGIPINVVVIFELILVISAMFNHAHMRIPRWLDRALSLAIVTPDMHRVHHGRDDRLDHRNYGFFLNIWDRVFKTHMEISAAQADALAMGTSAVPADRSPLKLLAQPFRRGKT